MKIAPHILLVAIAAAAALCAQQAPTIHSKVDVVTLFATVHDADGKVVKNLTKDDFILKQDGVPQKITYFSQESDLPLTIGLLVDTSTSQTGVLEQERNASKAFLDDVLREDKDQAFVAYFDKHVGIEHGLTSSRTDLASALDQLKIPHEYGTLIFSAIRECSEDVMNPLPGRKAFILLTDGVAFKDPNSITTAIEFAQRADTILYSIRFADPIPLDQPVMGILLRAASAHGKKGLQRMARETGGVMYEVTKDQPIETIYAQIEDALRNQYSIGYTPEPQSADGKYHKIKLTTKDRHQMVHARDGYYAK